MSTETLVIENTLKLIASILLWLAVAHTLLLGAIYFLLKRLFASTREHSKDNRNQ